jgi:hypothetical protein
MGKIDRDWQGRFWLRETVETSIKGPTFIRGLSPFVLNINVLKSEH